jgi:hypothetical protein
MALSVLPAHAAPPPASNDLTVQKSCDASAVHFEARAEWKYTYVAGGVTKARIDRLEWSIQDQADPDGAGPLTASPQGVDPQYDQDSDTTDYFIRVYDGNTRVQTLADEDADVYYANDGDNGELWFGRNPKNPVVKDGSRVTFGVGVADDGQPKCKVSFRIPAELGPELPE